VEIRPANAFNELETTTGQNPAFQPLDINYTFAQPQQSPTETISLVRVIGYSWGLNPLGLSDEGSILLQWIS
jgi:hypothetical protein